MTRGRIARVCALTAVGLAAAASAHAQAPAPQALSLAEALDYADRNYPAVKAALEDRVAADHRVDEAKTAYLPQVNLLYQINRATVNNITGVLLPQSTIPSISGPVLPQTGESDWNSAAGALLTWRVFDFGQRAAKVDAARETAAAAKASYDLTRLDVGTATLNAYLNVLAADALMQAAQANVERLQTFGKSVDVLVDNKLRPEVESQQAQAALALGQTQLIGSRANAEAQRATLAKLLGRPAEGLGLAAPTLPADPERVVSAVRRAQEHPAAVAEAAKLRQQQAQLSAVDRSYSPLVDLVAGAYSRGSGREPNGTFSGGGSGLGLGTNNWAAGLQVTLPLGAYPAVHAQQQAQRAVVSAEQDRYDQTLREVDERLQQARANLQGAVEIAKVTPTELEAARKAETQQRARFQSGLATAVDVTVAEAALVQAESQEAIAKFNVWRALGAYAAASGDLGPVRTASASQQDR
jgi:outer membrane protein TolC